MTRHLRIPLMTVLAVGALGLAAPASAGGFSFSMGASFSVGKVSFHVAYAEPGYGYQPYYYRTSTPLHYGGHACSSHCVRHRGYVYHAPACPLVSAHFSYYGYAPVRSYYYTPSYGHRHHGHYGHHGHHRHYRPHGHHGHGHYKSYHGHSKRHYGHSKSYRGYSKHYGHGGKHHGYGKKSYRGSKRHGDAHGHGRDRGGHGKGSARRTRPGRH